MSNPVKLQNKSVPWIASLFLLILLLLLCIVTVGASSGINEECSLYQAILIIEPIWIFIYYRLYSRLLIKLMDILTCECAEHGVGYAIFHYAIWATIGHPYVCFGPFVYANITQMIDIFNNGTCTEIDTISDIGRNIWNICFVIVTFILIIIVIPAGIVVSIKNHKDVNFQLHWKEQNAKQRQKAISNAIAENAETFVYTGPNDIPHHNATNIDEATANNTFANSAPNVNDINMSTDKDTDKNAAEVAFGDVNMDEFEKNHTNANIDDNNIVNNQQESDGDIAEMHLNRQDTEEQLRLAIAASMATAKEEEQKRSGGTTDPPPITRNASVSMSGFWAKGQNISSALLGNLFNSANYECVVCYEDYKIGDSVAKLKCGHMMHKKCAKDWLAQNPTCYVLHFLFHIPYFIK